MAETSADDIILVAPTGSGKTIAFTLRLLRALDPKRAGNGPLAVVIAPSRELTLQIAEVVRRVAVPFKVTTLYGGHRFEDEANSLSVTPDIVVATPGRLLDHLNRRTIDLRGVSALVLDEYDKSLELGFADEMSRIVRRMKSLRLRVLTSATSIAALPDFVANKEQFVEFDFTDDSGSPVTKVAIVEVPSPIRDKLDTLESLLGSIDSGKVIVFANHRESAERIFNRLTADGFPAGLYHGALEQSDRRHALQLLSNGTTPILVATDLAARGLDIPEVESVVHYHLPLQEAVWTHRNGRTARQGAEGTVYAIVADGETVPDFVAFDREFCPKSDGECRLKPSAVTLHFNAGRKEKVSRGDILGFLVKTGGVAPDAVGAITVDDHEATAAVSVGAADGLVERLRGAKLKGRRVRVTTL